MPDSSILISNRNGRTVLQMGAKIDFLEKDRALKDTLITNLHEQIKVDKRIEQAKTDQINGLNRLIRYYRIACLVLFAGLILK